MGRACARARRLKICCSQKTMSSLSSCRRSYGAKDDCTTLFRVFNMTQVCLFHREHSHRGLPFPCFLWNTETNGEVALKKPGWGIRGSPTGELYPDTLQSLAISFLISLQTPCRDATERARRLRCLFITHSIQFFFSFLLSPRNYFFKNSIG